MSRATGVRALVVGALVAACAVGLWRAGTVGPRAPKLANGRAVRVEVLNGTKVPRAGLAVAERLREKGFDVVDIRTADDTRQKNVVYDRTIVLDRVGEPRWADAVARCLGVQEPVRQRNDTLLLEVTVILGRDLAERYGGKR
ncbi:MAG: LytR C-terminal domain-containing protein [bacterium]